MNMKKPQKILISSIIGSAVIAVSFINSTRELAAWVSGAFLYDISGSWEITDTVESSDYNPYKGMKFVYIFHVQQIGKLIKANAEKQYVNGQLQLGKSRENVELEGVINDKEVNLIFAQKASLRETSGRYSFKIINKNKMIGSFETTAANSKGSAKAKKL